MPCSPHPTVESLSSSLLESKHCSTLEEAEAIADAILQDVMNKESIRNESNGMIHNVFLSILQDYLDLTREEAGGILRFATDDNDDTDSDDAESATLEKVTNQNLQEVNALDDDDGEVIGEGECELCERHVQLTKHHLIPKSTHTRVEPKLWNAATAITDGEPERAKRILGSGLEHAINQLQNGARKTSIRSILNQTCNICRPCHSAIHRTHDNMTLALHYNNIEQLLEDEHIYKFCQWASKQKPGKYAVKN